MILQAGHLHAAIGKNIGEHNGGTTCVGDNGATLALEFGMHKDGANGGELLTILAADDAGLAEESVNSGIVGGESTGVAGSGTATCCRTARFDSGNMAALVDEVAAVFEEALRVANLLHVEHDDAAGGLGVESLVEMFQNVLDADLSAVADSPDAVEGQTVGDAVLFDEDSGSARAGDEVNTVRVESGDRSVEAAGIVGVEEAGAVGADEGAADGLDAFDDVLLDGSTFGVLLGEACADDDEALGALLLGEDIDSLGAELSGDAEDGAINLGEVVNLSIAFHALHFGLFGVHGIDLAFEVAVEKVFEGLSARFVDITGGTAHNDATRI